MIFDELSRCFQQLDDVKVEIGLFTTPEDVEIILVLSILAFASPFKNVNDNQDSRPLMMIIINVLIDGDW